MNKYQEALTNILLTSDLVFSKDLKVLTELVNKATPKNPDGYNCPNCNKTNLFSKDYFGLPCDFCPDCGQAIDWHQKK